MLSTMKVEIYSPLSGRSIWVSLSGLFLIIAFFALSKEAYGQNKKIDSLKRILPRAVDTIYIDILYNLAYEYVDNDYDSGLRYATDAYDAANQFGDSLRIVKTGRIKSLAFRRLGMLDSSLVLSEEILPVARRYALEKEVMSILNGLGLVFTEQAKYDKALRCYFESLEVGEKMDDQFNMSVGTNNIGMVYYKLRDYDNALVYFTRAIQLQKELKSKYEYEIRLTNAALAYAYKNRFSEALNMIDEALSHCAKNCTKNVLMQADFTLGIIAFRNQKFHQAGIKFLESYERAKEINDERFQLDNIIHLVQIHIVSNNLTLAENYLDKAEKLIIRGSSYNREMIEVYRQLFSLYKKSENFEKVAFYQGKYITLKDSIFGEELTTNLMKIEAEHLEKENKAKIESQNKILALNEEVIIRQKYLNVFVGLVTLLLVALAIVLIRSNRQKQKINQLLDKKVRERTQELEFNQNVLQRACEERDVLIDKTAADIRRSLATIKGLCGLGKKNIHDACQCLEKVNATADNFSETINKLIYQKLPIKN